MRAEPARLWEGSTTLQLKSGGASDCLSVLSTYSRNQSWPRKQSRLVMRAVLSKAFSSTWNIRESMRPFCSVFTTSYQDYLKGEVDTQMLTLLQSTFPAVPITAEIVEGSSQLSDNFKALVAKTTSLQKIPFVWHIMNSEEHERQVKAKGDMKRFDFIHMIQMIYYVDNLTNTIKFYHSLLKNNGRLMIIIEAADSGWDTLWKTYIKELQDDVITDYRSSGDVIACLKSQGLKYEEHTIPNTFDITECFDPSSQTGRRLLDFMTAKDFYQSFTPEIRAGMLDLLRNKCSTEKDGRVFFNSNMRCILVHA